MSDKPKIESVKADDLPDDTKDDSGVTPDALDDRSPQTENADDNARPAPDDPNVPTDTNLRRVVDNGSGETAFAGVVRTDDWESRGYLSEDEAWDAIGHDDGYDVVRDGVAYRIVKSEE